MAKHPVPKQKKAQSRSRKQYSKFKQEALKKLRNQIAALKACKKVEKSSKASVTTIKAD